MLGADLNNALGMIAPRITSITGAIGPLTAGLLGVTAILGTEAAVASFFFDLAKGAAEFGSKIHDTAQEVGASAETVSTFAYAAKLSGKSLEDLTPGIKRFEITIGEAARGSKEAAEALKRLGINNPKKAITDLDGSLAKAIKTIHDAGTGVNQVNLAADAFGKRGGPAMISSIETMNGDFKKFQEEARGVGAVLSTEAANAADDFGDKLDKLSTKVKFLGIQFGLGLIPTITEGLDIINRTIAETPRTTAIATALIATAIEAEVIGPLRIVEGLLKAIEKPWTIPVNVIAAGPPALMAYFLGQGAPPVQNVGVDVGAGAGIFRKKAPSITPVGGGGGGKSHKDVLDGLRSTLVSLNNEWRKWDVALLDSANASAEAAQKQKLLDDVLRSLTSKTRVAISGIRDIDEALNKAVSSLPKKSQESARALIQESLAQFRANEQKRIAGEVNKEAERLTQSWRREIDNSRQGADEFTKAIQDLEKAYAKYGQTIDPATRAELEQLAAQQRILKVTRERLTVLSQIRERVVGQDVLKDLGGGSVVFRGDATRERIATVGEQILREREQIRIQEMREVAEDLGSIFSDVFDSIRGDWQQTWQDMARIAKNISRQLVQELFTGLFSRAFNVPFQSQSGGIVGAIINRIFGASAQKSEQTSVNLGGGSVFTPGGTGATRDRTVAGSRALGGPVEAGLLYRVNENRQEFFRPNIGGQVIPIGPSSRDQSLSRLYLVDDERAAFERGATRREIAKVSKQMRKIGKLVPVG